MTSDCSLVCLQLLNVNSLNSNKAALGAANQFGNRAAVNAATAKAKNLGVKTLLDFHLANAVNNKDQLGRLMSRQSLLQS